MRDGDFNSHLWLRKISDVKFSLHLNEMAT
jgi:hypothetical protein